MRMRAAPDGVHAGGAGRQRHERISVHPLIGIVHIVLALVRPAAEWGPHKYTMAMTAAIHDWGKLWRIS
jgi:hypothetical protein